MNSLKHETNNLRTKLTLVNNFKCEKTIKKDCVFIPGQSRVSSFSDPTVSRDDNIVEALPSNILPTRVGNESEL